MLKIALLYRIPSRPALHLWDNFMPIPLPTPSPLLAFDYGPSAALLQAANDYYVGVT